MSVPEMPWYSAMERAMQPLNPYTTFLLIGLAAVTVYIALKGDAVARTAWLVYLVSP